MTREESAGLPRVRFGQIAEFRNGLNFDAAATGQSVKVAGVGSFLQRSRLDDFSDAKVVTVRGEVPRESLLRNGDLLFVRSNGSKELVGRCAMVFPGDERVAFSGFTIRARITSDDVDGDYILAVARSELFRRELHEKGAGSSITNLSQELLSEVELPLPNLAAQRRIATALQTWDEAINCTERLIAAKQRLRAWVRSSLLSGSVRLGGFSEPWSVLPLAAVLHEHGESSAGDEPVFSVSVHKGLVDQVEHLGRSFSAADTSRYNRVLPGDVVYTKSPTGEFPSGVIKQSIVPHPVIVSPLYAVYTPRSYTLGILLDALFESPINTGNYLRPLVQKGAKNTIAITNKRFLEGALQLPTDQAEIDALAEIVRCSRREIFTLEKQLSALRVQKRGLMQTLLTGDSHAPERAEVAA